MLLNFDTFKQFRLSSCSAGTVMVVHTECGQEIGPTTEQFQITVLDLMDLIFGHNCPGRT